MEYIKKKLAVQRGIKIQEYKQENIQTSRLCLHLRPVLLISSAKQLFVYLTTVYKFEMQAIVNYNLNHQ